MNGLVMHPRRKVLVKASPYLYSVERLDGRAVLHCQSMSNYVARAILESKGLTLVESPCYLGNIVEQETLKPDPLVRVRGLFQTAEVVAEEGFYMLDVSNDRGELLSSTPFADWQPARDAAEAYRYKAAA